jgi:tetratricopeptide (TPR) repeat protein
VLAERQVQASRKEDVLRELGHATSSFREMLGESLASIKRYDAQIEMATTPSLDALKAYSQALAARRTTGERAALPLMRRAVELDPTFALAHARLGTLYANLLDAEASRRHSTRAFELREKVSELERLYIEARYYTTGQPDPAKAIEAYRVSIATYPTDYASRTNLAVLLRERGELEESLALLREATRLAPEEPSARYNLASGLVESGQFDEARTELDRVVAIRDGGASRARMMALAVLSGDAALEAQQREWATSHDDPTETLPMLLGAALYRGQLGEAERLVGELQRAYDAAGVPTASAGQHAGTATTLALAGAGDRARALMARLPGDGSADQTADERLITAALAGDRAAAARALPIALENARGDSESTAVLLRAMGRVGSGDLAGALAALGDVQYNRRDDDHVLVHGMLARRTRQWDVSIRDLTWYLANGRRQLSANRAVGMAELAQAYEGAGRGDQARAAYADFLEFWKTADADVPIVVEAKAALARLGS